MFPALYAILDPSLITEPILAVAEKLADAGVSDVICRHRERVENGEIALVDVPDAEVPPGTHTFRIEVKDNKGYLGATDFSFRVGK